MESWRIKILNLSSRWVKPRDIFWNECWGFLYHQIIHSRDMSIHIDIDIDISDGADARHIRKSGCDWELAIVTSKDEDEDIKYLIHTDEDTNNSI